MKVKTKKDRRRRIALRKRKIIKGTSERPRLAVFRSLSHISAQVINDETGCTLVAASSSEAEVKALFDNGARGGNKAGARVIGIAGGEEKCDYLRSEIGCDDAVDYKSGDLSLKLKASCTDGIDVFFDNVGGDVLDAALDNIAKCARVVICGAISQYNDMTSVTGPSLYLRIPERNASMLGFTVDHYADQFPRMEEEISGWIQSGELSLPEQVEKGIESFPVALVKLMTGGHKGKLLVEP